MQKNKFKMLIKKGEIAREKKDYKTALACFDEAMLISGKRGQWNNYLEVLGHKIVIDKHFWCMTKDKGFLEQMRKNVELGLEIAKTKKLPARYHAVFQLRMGDVLLEEKKYKKAVFWYQKAVKSLADTSKNASYGEYLGHLGRAMVLANKKGAEKILFQALNLVQKDKTVRPFHRLVLESAIIASLALFFKKTNPKESQRLFNKAILMAKELKTKYNMPMRLKQLEIMKKEFGL